MKEDELYFLIWEDMLNRVKAKIPILSQTILSNQLLDHQLFKEFGQKKINYIKEYWNLNDVQNIEELTSLQSNNNLNFLHIIDSIQNRLNFVEAILDKKPQGPNDYDKNKVASFINVLKTECICTQKQMYRTRPHIAVFTPLSPIKSGIADYTEDIIIQMKDIFEIDIFIDDGYKPTHPDIISNCLIHNHKAFETRTNDYDLVLYQLGNNPYHVYMIPYILKYHGIVELHDFKLSHLYSYLSPEYKEIANSGSDIKKYDNTDDVPFNLYLLENSLGVIVHSNYTKIKVLEQDATLNVIKIDHYAKASTNLFSAEDLKKKYGLNDSLVIASFGFVTHAKRIESCLSAFAQICKEIGNIKYLIVGQLDEQCEKTIPGLISELQITDNVIITGYTDLDSFLDYMELVDICINIRYPYGGETSGTISRIMGKGKACIVSDVGAFSEIPDDCCIKIPYGSPHETDCIYRELRGLLGNKIRRQEIGQHAKNYVKSELDIIKIVRLYEKFMLHTIYGPVVDRKTVMNQAAFFLSYNYFNDINQAFNIMMDHITEILAVE